MKIFAGLLALVALYLGFGRPDMVRIFAAEWKQAAMVQQMCVRPVSSDRLIQITPEHIAEPQPLAAGERWAQTRAFGTVLMAAMKATVAKGFASRHPDKSPQPGLLTQALARHLPTYFLPDRRLDESFLSLTGPRPAPGRRINLALSAPAVTPEQAPITKAAPSSAVRPQQPHADQKASEKVSLAEIVSFAFDAETD